MRRHCENLSAMDEMARELSEQLGRGVVYLHGDLGAGKTTLVRAWLAALSYSGAVKSPTYGLIENYRAAGLNIAHLDLYRLTDPEELEFLGIRDLYAETDLMFIEWPDRGGDLIPAADHEITLSYADPGRQIVVRSKQV